MAKKIAVGARKSSITTPKIQTANRIKAISKEYDPKTKRIIKKNISRKEADKQKRVQTYSKAQKR